MSTSEFPPIPPGLPDSERADVANRLHSLAIRLLRRVRTVDRATGLSPERLSVLSVLVFTGPRTMTDLAAIEMVSRPAITRMVKSLETLGLAARHPDPADRRRVHVRSTDKGRRLLERGRARRVALLAGVLRDLSPSELATVRATIAILVRR